MRAGPSYVKPKTVLQRQIFVIGADRDPARPGACWRIDRDERL